MKTKLNLIFVLAFGMASNALAGSATWNLNPTSGDWNTATNWTPATVPNSPSDTATFDISNRTAVSTGADTTIDSIIFDAGASAYAITISRSRTLTISGAGIINNSGLTQSFVTGADTNIHFGTLIFSNSATAGNMTAFQNNAGGIVNAFAGNTIFQDSANAGSASFVNIGSHAGSAQGGIVNFYDTSSAAMAVLTNNGAQNSYVNPATINFHDNSTAGEATIRNEVTGFGASLLYFYDNATAGHAHILSDGARGSGGASAVRFTGSSTAGNAIFDINGAAADGALGAELTFYDTTSPGNATIFIHPGTVAGARGATAAAYLTGGDATFMAEGATVAGAHGGEAFFGFGGTLGNANIIATDGINGGEAGSIVFAAEFLGGPARVQVFGKAKLDMSENNVALSLGSIEGTGRIFLGGNSLTVGSNNRSTRFRGVIRGSGTFTKVGSGTLVLTQPNTYTGITRINGGSLIVNNTTGSATGTADVDVNAGVLGGKGIIAGRIFVGAIEGERGVIAPGHTSTLTCQNFVQFDRGGTYQFDLSSDTGASDKLVANEVVIDPNAQFSPSDLGSSTLSSGTVFTAIDNTSDTPIGGTFNNLPEGGTIKIGNNTFQANYKGGDGNDLMLTVVP